MVAKYISGKSVQYIFTADQKGVKLKIFRREGRDEYLNMCAVFIKKY